MNSESNAITKEGIELTNRWLGSPSIYFNDRINSKNAVGRGTNAKRRAHGIVRRMIAERSFGPQFDLLNCFSCSSSF